MGSIIKKKEYREDKLLSVLSVKKRMNIKEIVDLLDISESTARRFLGDLEKKGMLIRTHGGVQLSPGSKPDYFYDDSKQHKKEQKARIGEYAASLVDDGDVVFLDSGTTLAAMANALAARLRKGDLKDVQIYTNSLVNLKALSGYCEVNLIGGLFRSTRQDFCGHLSEMVLNTIAFKKCFLGTDGISLLPAEGVMATDVFTAKVNEIVAERSNKIYILADSSKFNRRSFIRYADLKTPDLYITDASFTGEPFELLFKSGLSIKRI